MSKFQPARFPLAPSRRLLLAGASLLTLLLAHPTNAQTVSGMRGTAAPRAGGAPTAPGVPVTTLPPTAQAALARQTAIKARVATAMDLANQAQAAARAAALAKPSTVPNGLIAGGLVPAGAITTNPSLWLNANAPTQVLGADGKTLVTIDQTAAKAILTWDSFNVGKDTTVHFDQTKGTQADGSNEWIALNRINDPSLKPSTIQGMIKAEGSVYLINRNGVIFTGTAQVNTHSLIVSALSPYGENPNDPTSIAASDKRFLSAGLFDPFFAGSVVLGSSGSAPPTGDVKIDAGAQIETKEGGFSIIAGNNVTNAGSIVSNGGQTILFGGVGLNFGAPDKQGKLLPVNVGFPQGFPESIETGQFPDLKVVNTGTILALRGNVSLSAGTVEQNGLLMATTSITEPGSIRIDTKLIGGTEGTDFVGGAAIFAPGSLTAILPDANGGTTSTTPAADEVFEAGSITVNASALWFQHDSTLYAPGATVKLSTGGQTTFDDQLHGVVLGRIQVDNGAILSVAGLADVERPMSDNLVAVPRIGQNELADSPLQRDGILYKSPFTVDGRDSGTRADGLAWVGSPVANVGGYVQGVPRTIDQMLVDGGSITIAAGGIVLAPGGSIDVSGGYTQYLGGSAQTTRLIGADGRVYDAAHADPLMTYVGFAGQTSVEHNRWGVTDSFSNSLMNGGAQFESSYVEGGKGGSLTLASQQMILAGALHGDTVIGRYQIGGKEPQGASLSLVASGLHISEGGTDYAGLGADFGAGTLLATPELSALPLNDIDNILWTPNISGDTISAGGFGSVSLSAAMITVDADAALTVKPGGTINLTGAKMDVLGRLTAHSGQINLLSTGRTTGSYFDANVPDQGSDAAVLYPPGQIVPLRGDITIGERALLDVSGLWVNDQGLGRDAQTGAGFSDGGSISIKTRAVGSFNSQGSAYDTTGSIFLTQGSALDASGGGYVDMLGRVATKNGLALGRGGDVSLSIYADTPGWWVGLLPGVIGGSKDALTGGRLEMDGTIKGYGLSGGGTLTLQSLGLQIGGDATGLPDYTNYLSQDWFSDQGFGAYKLSAIFDATIADGATVRVSQRNYVADLATLAKLKTGADLGSVATLGVLDPYHRQATDFSLTTGTYLTWNANPSNRSFASPNLAGVSGSLVLGEGATIQADAGAAVALSAYGQLDVLGGVVAHGGSVDLTAIVNVGSGYDYTRRSLWLGKDSLIDVSGVALINPLAKPVRSGDGARIPVSGVVLDGGSVSIQGNNAFVAAEAGSRIDVSGASATLDIRTQSSNPFAPIAWLPTQVASNGGSIVLGSTNGLYYDGTLAAAGGGAAARGGTLQIASNAFSDGHLLPAGGITPAATAILLQQSGDLVTDDMMTGGAIEGGGISHTMHFAVDRLDGSGVDTLVLGEDPTRSAASYNNSPPAVLNTIAFAGDVDLSLERAVMMNAHNYLGLADGATSVPAQGAGFVSVGGSRVSIEASYVALAGGGYTDIAPVLAGGDATLDVNARQIDLMGQFTLQRFADANFTSSGDIRLMMPAELGYVTSVQRPGELVTAGDLTFKAGQVYPTTGNVFLIAAPTARSTITFLGNGSVTPPISVGGALLVDAANIVQDGTIRAPSGTIQLGVGDINDANIKTAFNNLPLIHTGSVTLGAGSLTSVSLDGRSLPYGTTTDGTDWALIVQNFTGTTTKLDPLTQAPEKLIGLAGDTVDFANGATVDLSGGGNLYAQEFVPGTGGSRDLLIAVNTSYSSGAAAAQVPLYADGREVYAVIPGYQAPVAAYDPSFGYPGKDQLSSVGKAVYLSGVPGLPDGVYTLLPGQYATIPGAFRVVQQTGTIDSVAHDNVTLADGSNVVSGRFVDALTGKSDARTTSFLVQSQDVWKQYSEYTITPADDYFPGKSAHAGTSATRTPVDAGRLVLAAVNSLILDGTLNAKAGEKGRGAAVDISAQAIQILGGAGEAQDGYLQVDATALSNLGAESLLIGGTRSDTVNGTVINAVSTDVLLSNDSGSALTGPEVMLVTTAGGHGLILESGSVLTAKGDIASPSTAPILIGAVDGASGDGALVRVSNGAPVSVIRANVPGLDGVAGSSTGLLDIRAGASINGGKSTILDATGNLLLDPGASFTGDAIDVNANSVAFLGEGSTVTPTGFVVGEQLLAQLVNVGTLGLHSRSAMTFYGDVDLATKQSLVLGASAFVSDGGDVTITAPRLVLTNDVGGDASFAAGSGTLTLKASELDFGAGDVTVQGFGAVTAIVTQGIVGQGKGSFDFGTLDVAMTAPIFTADSGANTSIKTTGALTLHRGAGTAITRETLGGALSLSGGGVTTDATTQALAGNVTLIATTGDLTLLDGAVISTKGYNKTFFDTEAYAPGGNLSLTASTGAIKVNGGATLDVSGADKGGDAGSLTLNASGVVTLDGVLKGKIASDDYRGGRLTLASGGVVDLDRIADLANAAGMTGALSITSGEGNLVLSAGKTLKGQVIYLAANGGDHPGDANGNVVVNGVIDVSGEAAGHIDLFGKGGVDLSGQLLATSSVAHQDGGVVTLGTTGVTDGSFNGPYGYETVQAADSGVIRVRTGALIDVSGGTADAGGSVSFRAPLLSDGDVRIAIDGGSANIKGAKRVTIEPYAKWSTTDAQTDKAKYFDGIIDPAGWYGADGKLVPGQWTDDKGVVLAAPADDAELKTYLAKYYFTPTTANADHLGFYGYAGGDPANGPGTLMGFVQAPGFSFGNRYAGIAGVHVRPGIELANPGETVNGGNVDVLTNWNLGAGETGPTGGVTLAYHYGFEAPVLTVRAEHDLHLKASITDGFYQQNDGAHLQDPITPPDTGGGNDNPAYDAVLASYLTSKSFLDANGLWNGTINLVAGGTADITHDPYYEPIRAPAVGQSDAYYGNYTLYIGDVGTGSDGFWAQQFNDGQNFGFAPYAPTPLIAPKPADFGHYTDYATAYESWLENNFPLFLPSDTTPSPLLSPIVADYRQYSADYSTYIAGHEVYTAVAGFIGDFGAAHQLAYAPFSPREDAAGGGGPGGAVPIAAPGPNNSPSNMPIAGRPTSLASATLLGGESSSYRLVAGADFGAADALAINRLTGTGSVSLDGHFEVIDTTTTDDNGAILDPTNPAIGRMVVLPNVIRTGVGAIDIAAASDITLLDPLAPGAIYTGGEPAAGGSAGTSISVVRPAFFQQPQRDTPVFLATPSVQPDNGGDITLTAGGDILGNQQVYDVDGAITGKKGAYIAPYWSPWLNSGLSPDTPTMNATTINFGNFDQGVLSAGGDVSVLAGGDIRELSVSLPTTWYLTGSGDRLNQIVNTVGGGDLSVEAGGDILGGAYFVAKGTGRIDAGGGIGASFTYKPVTNLGVAGAVSTILGIQDAQVQVTARGDLDIGRVQNPGDIRGLLFSTSLTPYTTASSLRLTSVTGDIGFDTLNAPGAFFGAYTGASYGLNVLLPATFEMNALNGDIAVSSGGLLYPSATGQLSLLADGDIRLMNTGAARAFGLSENKPSKYPSILNPLPFYSDLIPPPSAVPASSLADIDGLLHVGDPDPVRIYSLTGDIIDGPNASQSALNRDLQNVLLQLPKPAQIRAGRDIVNLLFLGQNLNDSDVSSIVAGRDIIDLPQILDQSGRILVTPGLIQLAGPGRLDIQAGRDLGPLSRDLPSTGIQTIGNLYNAYLPRQSADISVLFGTGPGVAWSTFAAAYLDPAATGTDLPSFSADLIAAVAKYQADTDKRSGGEGVLPSLTADQAWAAFQAMPEAQREALVEQTFFKILAVTGADYNEPDSPNFNKYARGYQAIETLFPSALGYTKNNLEGGVNGAATLISTGNLDIRGSTIQTQMGGDISIMGPGGQLLVGSTSSPPYVPASGGNPGIGPQALGILAWETGSVSIFSDRSLLLAQSRVFTERGGDMTIWSSNGDINAGKGNKTSSEIKPVDFLCSTDFYCRVDASSTVTGAGIAAFAGQSGDPTPTVTLVAPRGTVDAGDAGIRVAGNLIVAAQFVANADNIQVEGTTIGVPTNAVDVSGNLDASSAAASAVQEVVQTMQQNRRNERPSTITVTIDGFGPEAGDCSAAANACPAR